LKGGEGLLIERERKERRKQKKEKEERGGKLTY
jgi:hypothetical protein